jgi:hypothetical protein
MRPCIRSKCQAIIRHKVYPSALIQSMNPNPDSLPITWGTSRLEPSRLGLAGGFQGLQGQRVVRHWVTLLTVLAERTGVETRGHT